MQIPYYSLCIVVLFGTALSSPAQNRTQVTDAHNSAQASDKTPIASGNVYGTDGESSQDAETDSGSTGDAGSGDEASGQDEADNGKDKNQRGYNQGYSYNTGIKPYTTGYTYYQPFGDAAKNQKPQQDAGEAENDKSPPAKTVSGKKGAGDANAQQPMPVDLANIFDDNGIPNLDNLKLPPPPKGVKVQPLKFEAITTTTPRPAMPANFDGFDFNQLMGNPGQGAAVQQQPQQQQVPQNENMFDFAPPSNGNFEFAPNSESTMGQGDPQLMMGGGGMGNGPTNNSPNTGNGNNFGFGDQQVPSEIVNLNNAFGAGPSSNSAGQPDDLSNMVLGNMGSGQQQPQQQPMMDFGEFGAAAQQNPEQTVFPFGMNF